MRTVLTIWNTRIAPVFDVAGQALLVETEDGIAHAEHHLTLPAGPVLDKIAFLTAAGTGLLICGAISRPARLAAFASGIEVCSFIAGDVREVLQACLEGRLRESAFAMPGCGRKQGCHGRRSRGGEKTGRQTVWFFDENETS